MKFLVRLLITITLLITSSYGAAQQRELFPPEARSSFNDMPESEKHLFLNKRIMFLSLAYNALNKIEWIVGPIAVFRAKRQYNASKKEIRKLELEALTYNDGTRQEIIEQLYIHEEKVNDRYQEQMNKSKKELARDIIQATLRSLDEKLYHQAPLVAKSNEFGFMIAGGFALIAGKPNLGRGGILNLGLSVAINIEERSLAIQIITDTERYRTTMMPGVFVVGAIGKLGAYIANTSDKSNRSGTAFYPAFVPGFTSTTPNSFTTGASSGLTFPPSPLADALTYENSIQPIRPLRITISPLTKGFVRLKWALNGFDFVLTPIQRLIGYQAMKCTGLF